MSPTALSVAGSVILSSLSADSNNSSLSSVTLSGSSMLFRPLFANARLSSRDRPAGNDTPVSFPHSSKALSPIVSSESGSVTRDTPLLENAAFGISVMPPGRETSVRLSQL